MHLTAACALTRVELAVIRGRGGYALLTMSQAHAKKAAVRTTGSESSDDRYFKLRISDDDDGPGALTGLRRGARGEPP